MKLFQFKIIRTVAGKELKDFFRDPRSLILSIILPLILFPLLFWVLSGEQKTSLFEDRVFKVGVEREIDLTQWYIDHEKIAVTSIDKVLYAEDWRNRFDAVIVNHPQTNNPVVLYDNTRPVSIAAFSYLQQTNTEASVSSSKKQNIHIETSPIAYPMFSEEEAAGKMFLSLVLPFIFFIFAITCSLPVAADLSAGEKERGSLEPLLSTSASRAGIILGKLLAAFIASLCSVCAYILAVFISCTITPEIMGDQAMSLSLTIYQLSVLGLLLIIMTGLFTAIEICAGFITQSIREAQLLSMPLLVIGMGAVYTAQNVDIPRKAIWYSQIPMVNLALAIREISLGHFFLLDILSAFIWSAIYLIAVSILSIKLFQKESSFLRTGGHKSLLARIGIRLYSKKT